MLLFIIILWLCVTLILALPYSIGLSLYRGKEIGAKVRNVYKNKVVYEVFYKRGKSSVETVKMGSNRERQLATLVNSPKNEQMPISGGVSGKFQNTQLWQKISDIPLRKSMKIWMNICLAFSGLYIILMLFEKENLLHISMAGFFIILAVMFFVLGLSPKENPFILDRNSGLKKSSFVIICVIVAFVFFQVSSTYFMNESVDSQVNNSEITNEESNENISLDGVQKWYEDQMPRVSQSLTEYAQNVNGLSNLNVSSSRFLFGGEWSDCYYKFTFTCTVDGVNYVGEARAFEKYQDDNIQWFSFEIFDNDGIQSIVELYDDSYDQIIEDYYQELEAQYK